MFLANCDCFCGFEVQISMLCCRLNPDAMLSEVELLKLAAGVESNTIHPVGKAIVEAAQAAGCQNVKVHMYLVHYCFSCYYSWKAWK